jgi:hypothetical protein
MTQSQSAVVLNSAPISQARTPVREHERRPGSASSRPRPTRASPRQASERGSRRAPLATERVGPHQFIGIPRYALDVLLLTGGGPRRTR